MANPQVPYIKDSEQRILNKSFDPTYDVLAVENLAEYSGTLVRLQADENGNLKVTSSGSSSSGKATDAYGYQAKSNDGTYTYFFFESADTNYYILRKHNTTGQAHYAKGNGSYTTVYVDEETAPSGSPTWGTYGSTF